MKNKILKLIAITMIFSNVLVAASAVPEVEGVSFDPAFITAGDEVGISVNLREISDTSKTTWDTSKNLRVRLRPDNRLSEKYVTMVDDSDSTVGFLQPEGVFNKKFEVEVDSAAPTGQYRFEVVMDYVEPGNTEENTSVKYKDSFKMSVDSEGTDITTDIINTEPRTLRPDDNDANVNFRVINTGNKPLKDVEVFPELPEGFKLSFSGFDRFYVGRLEPGESKGLSLKLDVDEELKEGAYKTVFRSDFEDADSNDYTESTDNKIRVEGKPDLEVEQESLEMSQDSRGTLDFVVKNAGEQDAESVSARIVLERGQPFTPVDRSQYLGEIESGESLKTSFDLSVDSDADLRQHSISVELRSNGDRDEGDKSVYVFDRTVKTDVVASDSSLMMYSGLGLALAVMSFAFYRFAGGDGSED